MAGSERADRVASAAGWGDAAQAMYRAAQVVSQASRPALFADLVRELADILRAATVFIAVFADPSRRELRTLAARLDGRPLANFDYPLEGSPCAQVVGRAFRYVARGVSAEFRPGTIFGAKGMDSYAAFPLNDSDGTPIGLLVAMDRAPIADAPLAEALLKIFAGRIVAEIERSRADEALRAAALAVSRAYGESVFAELVRYLATILHVELAFIARHEPDETPDMRMMAVVCDGHVDIGSRYPLEASPCASVLGQGFRAFPSGLREQFPDDRDMHALALESYAGFPIADRLGRPLGTVGVSSRRPLVHVERIESMLQIFAVRAGAELEQLRAHEALRRSEASYRAIFESAEDAIFVHDWDSGEVLDVNPKACETYGYSRDELRHMSVSQISSGQPPYTGDEARKHIERAKLGRCPPFEWHRRNKDGSLHWDEVRLKPAVINGRPHILAFTRDITQHKAALAALQAREEQYRAVFNGSSDAMALWNRDLHIVDINRAFTRIFGFEREDVIGKSFGRRISPDAAARRVELIRAALDGQEGAMETDAVRKDGSRFDIELRYLPIAYAGEPHVLAVGRDISARRAADQALRDSEEQYRAVFNASADALVLRDAEFRVVEVNPAYVAMSGYARDEVLGSRRVMTQGDAGQALRREQHAKVLAGELLQLEATETRRDGTPYVAEVRGTPVRYHGQPHVLYVARDITQHRQAETQRLELERQLRQAQKMEAIGQLSGGIAHDFNNILTSVIGYVAMAQERAEAGADATLVRQLGSAQLAAERARDLVAQMLTFARRQRGERRLLALAPLVQQSLQLLRSTLPASVSIDAHQVADAGGVQVLADPVHLEQVLFNLCINARDAIRGSGWIRVRLEPAQGGWHCASCRAPIEGGRWVALSVADSGCGVSSEVIERMFEPFFSTKEVGHGSGMGLAMVHGIVHDHGGHIDVQSRPGEGATFRVMLPLPDGVAATAVPGPAAAPAVIGGKLPRLAGHVMVVEDEPMVGDFMAELLGGWGLQVTLERDPLAAATWLEQPDHRIDLLITDQTMPRLTGLELARRAVAARPALPVLLYSGHAEAVEAAELQRHGVHALLRKPLDGDALRALLQRWLVAEPG